MAINKNNEGLGSRTAHDHFWELWVMSTQAQATPQRTGLNPESELGQPLV
jgi:hypothetical protein